MLIGSKAVIKTQIFLFLFFFANYMKLAKLKNNDESMKGYFQAILLFIFDKINLQTPSIPLFKGFGMINLEKEIRIYQEIHTRVTMMTSMLSQFFLIRR